MTASGTQPKPPDVAMPTVRAEPAFLCDDMLAGLCRWLRAAGYDTTVAERGSSDQQIAGQTLHEGRVLLTCDLRLAELVAADAAALLLCGHDIYAWARELSERLAVDWMFRPFSRCLCCNTLLEPADNGKRDDLPPAVRGEQNVRYCSQCDKLFWEGSHARHMQQRLREWKGRYTQAMGGNADKFATGVNLSDFDLDPTD